MSGVRSATVRQSRLMEGEPDDQGPGLSCQVIRNGEAVSRAKLNFKPFPLNSKK